MLIWARQISHVQSTTECKNVSRIEFVRFEKTISFYRRKLQSFKVNTETAHCCRIWDETCKRCMCTYLSLHLYSHFPFACRLFVLTKSRTISQDEKLRWDARRCDAMRCEKNYVRCFTIWNNFILQQICIRKSIEWPPPPPPHIISYVYCQMSCIACAHHQHQMNWWI